MGKQKQMRSGKLGSGEQFNERVNGEKLELK